MRFFFLWILSVAVLLSRAGTVVLCPSCPLNTLPQAVAAAQPGDTILLKQGNYVSVNTTIDKPLTLIGENFPILDGQRKDEVIIIRADNVSLIGLDVRNTKIGSLKDYAAVRIAKSRNARVENCRLRDAYFGIYLTDVTNAVLQNNRVIGADYAGTNRGNGIQLWQSSDNKIAHNTIENHRDGIYLEFSKRCHIENNLSTKNIRYGLHFMFSDSNSYISNVFKSNGTGVAVMYTTDVSMYNNIFEDNWGDAAYGLLLKDIKNSVIVGNKFRNNTIAVTMESSDNMRLENNDFEENGYAIKVMANCRQDTFRWNNFRGNTFDAGTNGELVDNLFAYNYWDKYEGYDLNRDQIGDVPYCPVSLYSMIIENMPYAVILLRSFLVDILDRVERSMPSIVPNSFEDTKPLMKTIKR